MVTGAASLVREGSRAGCRAAHHAGFSVRKAAVLRQFVGAGVSRWRDGTAACPDDLLYLWGDHPVPFGWPQGAPVVRVEDGFLRSVGLGAAWARPVSWTFDHQGLHHWGHQATDLEQLLLQAPFDASMLQRAARLRQHIVEQQITKYNVAGGATDLGPRPPGRRRLLVIGQVADDAALRTIDTPVRNNLELLAAVRRADPAAQLVYRPHPEVQAGLRAGRDQGWERYADLRHTGGSATALFGQIDELHVMNSLTGFEALLRGTRVVCHAQPFYAGWGLTIDRHHLPRRQPRTLDQLVAAALIRYPVYRDPATGRRIEVEQALDLLVQQRRDARHAPLVSGLRAKAVGALTRIADQLRLQRLRGARPAPARRH